MSDFFKKLNVLVKASVHELLGDESAAKRPNPGRMGREVDQELPILRQRINDALDYEDELTGRAAALRAEVEKLDADADQAVNDGRDEQARYLLAQMQRTQQRLAMAESDLREHQLVTQELIQRVNELDAAIADARHAEEPEAAAEPEASDLGQRAAGVLRDMRQKISSMSDLISAQAEVQQTTTEDPVNDQQVEDDLVRRRDRLSKK